MLVYTSWRLEGVGVWGSRFSCVTIPELGTEWREGVLGGGRRCHKEGMGCQVEGKRVLYGGVPV